jgi:hypothetical protein
MGCSCFLSLLFLCRECGGDAKACGEGGGDVGDGAKRETIISVLPSAYLVLENIGSVYPFYVWQRWCSLLYDVYWLARWWCATGSKYLEYNPGSELNIYWWTWKLKNEIESNKNNWMKQWTKVEQRRITNRTNITIIHNNNWQLASFTI